MTSLMEVIKEQCSFGFTGKINLLLNSNGQFYGVLYLHEGFIVGASCGNLMGKNAVYKMVFDDVETNSHFKFIVEPEVISENNFSIKLTYEEIKIEAQKIYQQYVLAKKLRPAMNLRLVINPEVIVSSDEITPLEFQVLSTLTEHCLVSEVYKFSPLMEFDVTNALVSLRKKRAIKVFQN